MTEYQKYVNIYVEVDLDNQEVHMGRQENIEVFENTMTMCKSDPSLRAAVKASNSAQSLILEGERIELPTAMGSKSAKLTVSRKRTLEAAAEYSRAGKRVCVLNFASASNPGGGVKNGSSAQEEAICRCSTLYMSLIRPEMWSGFYTPHRMTENPLHNDDCIYTPGVVVFKTDDAYPKIMPPEDRYSVDVITCAAPNLREKPSNSMNYDGQKAASITDSELQNLHEKRMRRILSIAAQHGADVVILGAFGCGAFMNPPEIVAAGIKSALSDFVSCFETVEIAVYCSKSDDTNFRVFERAFRSGKR